MRIQLSSVKPHTEEICKLQQIPLFSLKNTFLLLKDLSFKIESAKILEIVFFFLTRAACGPQYMYFFNRHFLEHF